MALLLIFKSLKTRNVVAAMLAQANASKQNVLSLLQGKFTPQNYHIVRLVNSGLIFSVWW
jgi:hypothetical protein